MTRGARKAGLVLSVLTLSIAGCTDEPTPAGKLSDEPSASASASPSTTSDEQAVADVYKKYFETIQGLGSADDATIRAKLAPYAEQTAVERVVTAMQSFRSLNRQPAGSVVFAPLTIDLDGDSATVRECHDGTTELIVDSTTGAVISNGSVKGLQALLSKAPDGSWRVVSHDLAGGVC